MPADAPHRSLSPDRVEAVGRLLARVRAAGGHALSDHLRLDLERGGGEGFLAVFDEEPGGEISAYGQASTVNEGLVLEVVIDPGTERSGAANDVRHRLASAVLRATGDLPVTWWRHDAGDAEGAVERSLGFAPTRTLHQMRRPLPAERRAEISTRDFVPGVDDDEWVRVNNRAFARHGEQGGWTVATLRLRQAEPWFDPAGFRVHERAGRIAGFCWTKVHPAGSEADVEVGEIYVIAVDPDFQGLGLGSELTLAGLDHLSERGIGIGLLYVDGDNRAAIGMYERLGFAIHRTSAAWVRRSAR